MPMMNSAQLAALVERARQKALPVVVSPPQPARTARRPVQPQKTVPAPPVPAPQSDHGVEAAPDDFPVGWELRKESWHFHRRFYRVFRRPMAHGEYSHLSQVRAPSLSRHYPTSTVVRTHPPSVPAGAGPRSVRR